MEVSISTLESSTSPPSASSVESHMVAPSTPSVEWLRSGLGGVPQEVFDQISNLVVDYDSSAASPRTETTLVRITGDYRPPYHLQLNRKIRQTYAKDYYTRSTFFFVVEPVEHPSQMNICEKWLHSIGEQNRETVRDVRCKVSHLAQILDRPTFGALIGVSRLVGSRLRFLRYGGEDEMELLEDVLTLVEKEAMMEDRWMMQLAELKIEHARKREKMRCRDGKLDES